MSALELKEIEKSYLLDYRYKVSLKSELLNLFKKNSRPKRFWALKDINLSVQKGETLGIIGRNGSGKTTLLKIICGITRPTKGTIKIDGKVVALSELGAGFQGDLTGRENIYLNGAILGLSRKEIQKRIPSIIDFADIGNFIEAPVRTYSTGMYLRLGFAIATHIDADILLIDEILAVGDAGFQSKCLKKMDMFKNQGKTIILVSHNLDIIKRFCERVILIDKSNIVSDGKPEAVINRYLFL